MKTIEMQYPGDDRTDTKSVQSPYRGICSFPLSYTSSQIYYTYGIINAWGKTTSFSDAGTNYRYFDFSIDCCSNTKYSYYLKLSGSSLSANIGLFVKTLFLGF